MRLAEILRSRRIPSIISDLLRRNNSSAAIAIDEPSLADQLGDDHVASTEEAPPLSRNIADMDVNSFLDGIETAVLLDGQGRIRVNPAIRSAILSVGLDARYFSRLHDIIIGREVIATHKYSSRYGERCKYFDADGFKALAALCKTLVRRMSDVNQKPESRTTIPWRDLIAETKRELGDNPAAARLHDSSKEAQKRNKVQEEAAKKDSDSDEADKPQKSGREALAARPDEPISVAVKGSFPVTSAEERELRNRTPDLDRNMEETVRSFDKGALGDLLRKIPRSVSSVDFVRLGIPEYVVEVITFIHAVWQRKALTFDLSLVSEINYATFRSAVYICHKYLEAYEHNQQTPVKDLLRLYILMRIAAKDQIRKQRMAVEISREPKE